MSKQDTIQIETMLASRSLKGKVILRWGTEEGELSPYEAREHAMKVMAAADAAETDEFLFGFIRKVGDDKLAAAALKEFREFRERLFREIGRPK